MSEHESTSTEDGSGNAGGARTQNPTDPSRQTVFLLYGSATFEPFYAPKRISVTKERDLNRQGNFCGGEDVTDMGSKNRAFHVSGRFLESELSRFEVLLDHTEPLDVATPGWGGEVMISEGEYEGPLGIDPRTREYFFKYSLDVVSTGKDESDGDQHDL
jgi:hypothetical protein